MSTRWTKRRDGIFRTNMQVTFHVPHQMLAFLTDHGMNVGDAERWLRSHLIELADDWRTLAMSLDGTEPTLISLDDAGIWEADVYDGPTLGHKWR